MTGPGPGKIPINARVVIIEAGVARVVDANVYLHVRGWSRAFITHIDVEHPGLEALVGVGRRVGAWITGVYTGFIVEPRGLPWRMEVRGVGDEILRSFLSPGEGCRGCVGGKRGGVFIGFEARCLRRLEDLARRLYGVEPRRYR